jgi:hypothetical protein
MKTFFNLFFFLTVFFSIAINAQNNHKYSGLWSEKQSGFGGKNLKDSVKTVYFKMGKLKQSLSKSDQDRILLENGIRNFVYLNIDKYGRIKTELSEAGFAIDTFVTNINYKRTDDYIYDDKDWAKKSKYETALKQYYPVQNYSLLLKQNRNKVEKKTYKLKGKIWQELSKDVYIYIYDEKGRIKEEQEYNVYRFGEIIKDTIQKNEDLEHRTLFTYNDKGQVISQKIIADKRQTEASDDFENFKKGISDHRSSYYWGSYNYCADLQLKYKYDVLGRITQFILYDCDEIASQEDYSYHTIQDYVEKIKYHVTGPEAKISYGTHNFERTFNEEGDMIKMEFIPDFVRPTEDDKPILEYYYTYEYDSHNNWIKCNIYMEGVKEGEPSLVAERKIEYYN